MADPDPSASAASPLIELLRWYAAMGVDAVVDEAPHDRFEEAAAMPAPRPAAPASSPAGQGPAVVPARTPAVRATAALSRTSPMRREDGALPLEAAVHAAREKAASAASLEELRDALEHFDGCALKRTASRLVFGDGNERARIMLMGEAPGAEEDRSGVPFVGRGGQLLDRMLASIGLDRTSVYIANVVPWRPPGNRTPTPLEVATCLPFTRRQLELVDPDVLVLLGGSALAALVPDRTSIMRARGRWIDFSLGARTVRAIPMLHPAYLLRQPAQKKLAWQDLRTLATALRASG